MGGAIVHSSIGCRWTGGAQLLEIRFAETRRSDVEQELTQKDQFDTDKVPLPATLIREAIQNTNDARADDNHGPVTMRIGFHKATAVPDFLAEVFAGLKPHLVAVDVATDGLDFDLPDFLTLEDFGTTGLTGSLEVKDSKHFSDFWRRIGRSHKGGSSGGSWGLGKLVFPFSSRIYTMFGLTVREGEEGPGWLMGQTILSTHTLGGVEHMPHGFSAEFAEDNFAIPTGDRSSLEAFRTAAGFFRTTEPGLSLAIPFPRDELSADRLIPLVIEHYFFPILTGRLIVHVGDVAIDTDTVNLLIETHKAGNLTPAHIEFIRELHAARTADAPVHAPADWAIKGFAAAFDAETLDRLRTAYARGELLHVRAPLTVKPKDASDQAGEFDLFLRVATPGVSPVTLFVRNAITIPNEARSFVSPTTFGALVAASGPVAAFLRDAENPAHTLWNGRAEKLVRRWRSPSPSLAAVRKALRDLNQALENSAGVKDPDALLDLLNIRRTADSPKPTPNPIVRKPKVDIPPPQPPRFRLRTRSGGFSIVAGPALTHDDLPMKLLVRCGYAVARGNALKRWDPNDFEFSESSGLATTSTGATLNGTGNRLALTATESTFEVDVAGFDVNRDVVVVISEIRE